LARQIPGKLPTIFAGSSCCAYALYPVGSVLQVGGVVEITSEGSVGKLVTRLSLPEQPSRRSAPIVHHMAGRKLLQDIDEGCDQSISDVEAAAVQVSLQLSVLCKSTAFVAVDRRFGVEFPMLVEPVQSALPAVCCATATVVTKRRLCKKKKSSSCCDLAVLTWPRSSSPPKSQAMSGRSSEASLDTLTMANLEAVLRLSAADGSFCHSAKLEGATGISQQMLERVTQELLGKSGSPMQDRVLVTALVIAYLRKEFASERATWHLVAEKSACYLNSRIRDWRHSTLESLEDLISKAAGFLPVFPANKASTRARQ